MIPIEYYKISYFGAITFYIIAVLLPFIKRANVQQYSKSTIDFYSKVLLLLVISFIGLRDPFASSIYLGDTGTYTRIFGEFKNNADYIISKDGGFYLLMKFCSMFLNVRIFYVICAILYITPLFIVYKKKFKRTYLFLFILTIVSFSFWSYGINTMRSGLAGTFFISSFFFSRNKKIMLMTLSFFIHSSIILAVVAYLITLFNKKTKDYLIFWMLSLVFSFVLGDRSIAIFQFLGVNEDKTLASLSSADVLEAYNSGFQFTFIIYSFIPLCFGYYYLIHKKYTDQFYRHIFNIYVLMNAVWLWLIYVPFTDRFAYLSWMLIPLVIGYPLCAAILLKNQIRKYIYIILTVLFVTLLLNFK